MFSATDVRDILQALPPQPEQDGALNGLPKVSTSTTGRGLVTTEHAFENFEHLVATSLQKQIPIADLSQELDIEPDAVLRFAQARPTSALLTRDHANILSRKQRDFAVQQLGEDLANGLVSKDAFSKDHNISPESIDSLIRSDHYGATESNGFLDCATYRTLLAEAIKPRLDESLQDSKAVELSATTLPGTPPTWFIFRSLSSVLKKFNMDSDFNVNDQGDTIICTPKASMLQKRDAEIDQLRKGAMPILDVQKHYDDFRDVYPSKEDVEKHLATNSELEMEGDIAISSTWLTNFGDQCAEAVKVLGYADLTTNIRANFPYTCHDKLIDRLEKHILAKHSEQSDGVELLKAGDYLMTSTRYNTDRELLLQSASIHASQRWQELKEDLAKELKFDSTAVTAFIPEEQTILRSVAEDSTIKKAIEEEYWNEISLLETANEADFSSFWVDRVVARVANYAKGLEAIDDAKLEEQLSELLSTYVAKELIPESIAKARERGLLRSRKTTKNIQKLETTPQKKSTTSTSLSALEKFNSKQGIPHLDIASQQNAKQLLVEDMMNRMQKSKDPPMLFLLLIVVLLAKRYPGLLYATGKFAPKLMKLLKPSLAAEQYEQLEKWKDAAKAGSLSKEDREGMRGLAADTP